MQKVYSQVKRILDTTMSVLLTGETGTGKSMIAYYIHSHSPRKEKLFIAQNCGALPEGLLESELFGHKRGSFTGAISDGSSPRTKRSELAYVTKNKRFSPCKQDVLPGYKGG
jgi:transcriptional regulator with PAS, ATPase and Fis domain